ncbi:hypothetical protein J8I26_06210 [Herbaspirillum sp. LeCh32-8]|uniref:hypothetical protein n=1 Tax=Herbaspirillum sp. LeCh32-8 TaxID=2821356 RepID=UPI001AE2A593|nr:hypothetical protein [Herbaspirillum sp. LeCh32-8]MBP0597687.1 hypothetical protein [Herbaspirillum sp. LeCh32-8]
MRDISPTIPFTASAKMQLSKQEQDMTATLSPNDESATEKSANYTHQHRKINKTSPKI